MLKPTDSPAFRVFYNQNTLTCDDRAETMLEDFCFKCLANGMSEADIIQGLGDHYRQCEQVCKENLERVKAKLAETSK